VLNSAVAFAAFQATDRLPGAINRSRQSRGSNLKRRQW
jgi:hypothetical protein